MILKIVWVLKKHYNYKNNSSKNIKFIVQCKNNFLVHKHYQINVQKLCIHISDIIYHKLLNKYNKKEDKLYKD